MKTIIQAYLKNRNKHRGLFLPLLLLISLAAHTSWAANGGSYDKLFSNKEKLKTTKGFITVHQYEEKLYLEVPKKLMGREFLISSVITNSSEWSLSGTNAAPQKFFSLDRTDSLVLVKEARPAIFFDQKDSALQKALNLSRTQATLNSFPIKGYNSDSTALIFECTSFLAPGSKSLFNLEDRNYGGSFTTIESVQIEQSASYLRNIDVYSSTIALYQTVSAKLTTTLLGLQSRELPVNSFEYTSYLMLLPQEQMSPRVYHPEIGSLNLAFDDYRDLSDVRANWMVSKVDLTRKQQLTFYVDTLLPPGWRTVIQGAIEKWNDAFDSQGLGRPLKTMPFPSDAGFDAFDPTISTFVFNNNPSKGTSYFGITDPRTGEIISGRITIGKGMYDAIRTNGMVRISAVDDRFRTYYVEDKVIEEVMMTYVLRNIGRALGLTTNLAGSMAYAPDELRSPDFTNTYGISASVMDDVVFNSMARPGDRERGVKLTMDVVGPADKLAIAYLYSEVPDGRDEKEYLDKMVAAHYGDPKYRFLQLSNPALADPRGQFSDLSNDPIQSMKNRLEMLRYVIKNITKWVQSDDIPAEFKKNLAPWLFSEAYFNAMTPLLEFVGGVYSDGKATPTGKMSFKAVKKEDQRAAMRAFCDAWDTLHFLNENKELIQMNGAGSSMTDWAISMGLPIKDLMTRTICMTLSIACAGDNPYTEEDMLKDLEDFLLSDVKERRPISDAKIAMINQYIVGLITLSPKLKEMYLYSMAHKKSLVAVADSSFGDNNTPASDFLNDMRLFTLKYQDGHDHYYGKDQNAAPIRSVPFFAPNDLTKVGFKMLNSLEQRLRKARSLSNKKSYQSKIDYNLILIRHVLDNL